MKNTYGMEKKQDIKQINKEVRGTLSDFLTDDYYQDTFKDMAKALGYEGDDIEKIRASLFTTSPKGEIGFCLAELNDMFFEYQIIDGIKDIEPYKSLLEREPEKRNVIAILANKLASGTDIENEDLEKVFNK